jgi:hypothetical protein
MPVLKQVFTCRDVTISPGGWGINGIYIWRYSHNHGQTPKALEDIESPGITEVYTLFPGGEEKGNFKDIYNIDRQSVLFPRHLLQSTAPRHKRAFAHDQPEPRTHSPTNENDRGPNER